MKRPFAVKRNPTIQISRVNTITPVGISGRRLLALTCAALMAGNVAPTFAQTDGTTVDLKRL